MTPTIAVFTTHPELIAEATQRARALHLPFQADAQYLLMVTPEGLSLQQPEQNHLPLSINFNSHQMNYRRKSLKHHRESLVRALGLKKNSTPFLVDATAGLARDSFILAALGFNVHLIERSSVIHALIQDGMLHAKQNPEIAPIIERMHLIAANAIDYLKLLEKKPDLIYLDPMFCSRKKSALPKKEMRMFHDIVGDDADSAELLHTALACAAERVVVKRARLSADLTKIKPSFRLLGSSCRFDVYLTRD